MTFHTPLWNESAYSDICRQIEIPYRLTVLLSVPLNKLSCPTTSNDQNNFDYLEMNRNNSVDTEIMEEIKPSKFQRLRKTSVMIKSQFSKASEDSNDSTNW